MDLKGSALVSPSLRLVSEEDKSVLLQIPSSVKYTGISDLDILHFRQANRASCQIFREGLSEPPVSLWLLILVKGESALDTHFPNRREEHSLTAADDSVDQAQAIFVLLKSRGIFFYRKGRQQSCF